MLGRAVLASFVLTLAVAAHAAPPPVALQRPREARPAPGRAATGFVQLESDEALHVLRPERAWGTPRTVEILREVAREHRGRFPEAAPIVVGDLSRERGGRLSPHRSHRRGRDVDLRLPQQRGRELRLLEASARTLDLERTWFVIDRLLRSGDVEYIFLDRRVQRALRSYARSATPPLASADELAEIFQYPRSPQRWVGVVRHEPGHTSHLHVRFRRAAQPSAPPSSTLLARAR